MTDARQRRTRVKICGLTRREDVEAAIHLGADALGFVLWPKSPRAVSVESLARLTEGLPPFVTTTALFVNATRSHIADVLKAARITLLQFHGDESPDACRGHAMPYLRAARVEEGLNLLEFESRYSDAQALLLDAHSPAYGGSGKVFDWSLIPAELGHRVVLSGGLNAQNVAEAVSRVHPYAVDVSSGVESTPGIKDHERLRDFFKEIARADATFQP